MNGRSTTMLCYGDALVMRTRRYGIWSMYFLYLTLELDWRFQATTAACYVWIEESIRNSNSKRKQKLSLGLWSVCLVIVLLLMWLVSKVVNLEFDRTSFLLSSKGGDGFRRWRGSVVLFPTNDLRWKEMPMRRCIQWVAEVLWQMWLLLSRSVGRQDWASKRLTEALVISCFWRRPEIRKARQEHFDYFFFDGVALNLPYITMKSPTMARR